MLTVITNEEALKNVSWNLCRILEKRKIPQAELARMTGDSQQIINQLCNAKFLPNIALVARIATALKIEIELLLRPVPRNAIPPLPTHFGKNSENFSKST
jgi:transcriptional regulator with XRE-family HTH domain